MHTIILNYFNNLKDLNNSVLLKKYINEKIKWYINANALVKLSLLFCIISTYEYSINFLIWE